ncbi:MAG: hypothetical protein WAW17_00950 [Rhodococcus sp. (in: high G+C Gram-positive bacteria)]|uniref:DUF6912 family protein n=1 Tax=Rhodococcus sp. TaxID=1831 RepID=UPI003BAFAB92
MTRVYVPATIELLNRLLENQEFDPMSRTAFAVTATLREAYSSGDDEELAEVAMAEAARASLRLIAGRVSEGGSEGVRFRRVVVAADVDDVTPRPDLDDAVVRLPGPVNLRQVAAVHVDLAEAERYVELAVDAIDEADLGDPDAEFVLGDVDDHVLAWYATQELPFLLELL